MSWNAAIYWTRVVRNIVFADCAKLWCTGCDKTDLASCARFWSPDLMGTQ